MIVVAHISDPHFDGGARSGDRAGRVMRYLNGLPSPVAAIIVTGDVADHGLPEEYRQARESLTSDRPIYFIPGNHDERGAFRAGLIGGSGTGPINHAHRVGNGLVVLCDSDVPGRPEGHLDDETLEFLHTALADAPADAPVLIGLHHPPVRLFTIVDPILLDKPGSLAHLVANDPRIVGVVCGHAHTSAATMFAGKPLIVAPSVNSVIGPDWEGGTLDDNPVIDYDVPPGIAIHVIDDERRLTSHFRVIA